MPGTERQLQLTAILRGIRPHEIIDVAAALLERGVHAIEVPLNSPEPLDSIQRLAAAFGERCLCGAAIHFAEHHEARLALHQRTDRRTVVRPLDEIAFPMAWHQTRGNVFGAVGNPQVRRHEARLGRCRTAHSAPGFALPQGLDQ